MVIRKKTKKKSKKKRQASSPVNDNYNSVSALSGKECVNTGERKKAKTKKCKKDNKQDIASCLQTHAVNFVPNLTPDYNFGMSNMFAQAQGQSQGMSQ